MKNIFSRAFTKILLEDTASPEMSDKEAMLSTLDKDTDPSAFDVDSPTVKAYKAMQEAEAAMSTEVKSWTDKIGELIKFLNDPTSGSINSKLKDAVEGTLFFKIKKAEQRQLAKVAADLSSFNENLKGYINAANTGATPKTEETPEMSTDIDPGASLDSITADEFSA